MSDVERLCAKAILQAMALGKELENDLDGHVKVSAITYPYCETISQTYELAKVHDGECTKHPMARRVAALETELASARNLYAAQEERCERGRKAEDAWSAAMASVYLATSGCSLPEFDTPMEVAERIKEHFAALSDEVDHLRADKELLDSRTIQLLGYKRWVDIDLRARIDAARKAAE